MPMTHTLIPCQHVCASVGLQLAMRSTNQTGGGHDVTAHEQHDRPSGSGGVVGVFNESAVAVKQVRRWQMAHDGDDGSLSPAAASERWPPTDTMTMSHPAWRRAPCSTFHTPLYLVTTHWLSSNEGSVIRWELDLLLPGIWRNWTSTRPDNVEGSRWYRFIPLSYIRAVSNQLKVMVVASIHAYKTRKPCCRKETARCCSCSFRFKIRRQHTLQV